MTDTASGLVKIGKTGANNTPQRLKQLQTGNGNTLTIVRTVQTKTHKDAYALEREMHDKYSSQHYNGEWFKGI